MEKRKFEQKDEIMFIANDNTLRIGSFIEYDPSEEYAIIGSGDIYFIQVDRIIDCDLKTLKKKLCGNF